MLRGMLGTALTFSVGAGLVAALVAAVALLIPGGAAVRELFRLVVGSAIWAFPIGLVFSGFLALTARNRAFTELSLLRFTLLGAGGGLLLFGLLALNAWEAWSTQAALTNLTVFLGLGAGAAGGSLVVARRAASSVEAGEPPMALGPDGGDSDGHEQVSVC